MEKWQEVFKDIIPEGNYQTRLLNGEEQGLIIELFDSKNAIIIDFGIVQAVRILDEGIVQTKLYSVDEIGKYKNGHFRNVIYEIFDGEFENQIRRIADTYWEVIHPKHYIIITMNYIIEIIAECEPAVKIKKFFQR